MPFHSVRYGSNYTPPRLDAREAEAASVLKHRPHMNGITVNGIRCQWNLRPETAQRLFDAEVARRADDVG
jgi:hypothetical protein